VKVSYLSETQETEESIAASKVGQENQFQGMEKFDEHEINYDQRDEATSKGEYDDCQWI